MKDNIYLIGFMGSGKSAAAAAFRRQNGFHILEMDEEIGKREEMTIPEIFAQKGEDYFRALETELLRELSGEKGIVVSCGGGVPMRRENVELMKKAGRIVLLTASPETILMRVGDGSGRPLLAGKTPGGVKELMEARRPFYESAADICVQTDGKTPEMICREILEKIG